LLLTEGFDCQAALLLLIEHPSPKLDLLSRAFWNCHYRTPRFEETKSSNLSPDTRSSSLTAHWLQASSAIKDGAKMLFVAQFDEMDEGTQIFKCSHRVPVGESPFVAYEEGIETDHYLWLTGKVGELLRGEMGFTTNLPKR
jgi:hypothetical protein